MKAILLAAGYATRLYPLTKNQPKPLLKIGDKTIADYLLEKLAQIPPIDKVYVVTNARFFSHFERWARQTNDSGLYPGFEVEIVNDGTTNNDNRLGAVADIQYVIDQKKITDEIVITAGDNIFNFDFSDIYSYYREKGTAVILVHPLEDESRLTSVGIVERDQSGRVVGFEEKPAHPKSNLIAPPVYFLPRERLGLVNRFLHSNPGHDAPGNFIAWLHKQIPVYAYLMKQNYLDIGTLEMYNRVKDRLSF